MDMMENLSLPYLVSIAIALLVSAYLFINTHKTKPNQKLLPPPPGGRAGWPVFGETFDYLSNLRKGCLEKFVYHRRLKYSSEVFISPVIGYSMAILCGAKGNKFLFTNEERLVRVWFPHSVEKIFPKKTHNNLPINEDAKKFRKSLLEFLKPSGVQGYVSNIDAIIKQQIKGFARDGTVVNVREMAGNYTMAVGCRLLLGVSEPGWIERIQDLMKDIAGGLLAIPLNVPGTAFGRAVKAARVIFKEMEEMIKQRRIEILRKKLSPTEMKMEDILSNMVLDTDEGGRLLSEANIASRFMGLMHAGFDPARSGLTFVVKYLAEFPEICNEVRREQMEIANSKGVDEMLNWEDISKMKYSWNVACEVFRLMPPVAGTFREAITDFTYEGHAIAKGTKFHWVAQSTHNDPNYFPNAKEFDPSRFESNKFPAYSYVPFGGGPRMCPGQDYTKLLTLVFMHNMVTKFKWEMVIPNEKVVFDPHPRPIQGLPIRLVLCKP